MSYIKPKRIVLHGCYSASNKDLGIKNRNGELMGGEHDVFAMTRSDNDGYVYVKTITSLENVKKDGSIAFHLSALKAVKVGLIIPIPDKQLNASKLSGVHMKSIKIHKSKLHMPNNQFKYPKRYNSILKKQDTWSCVS